MYSTVCLASGRVSTRSRMFLHVDESYAWRLLDVRVPNPVGFYVQANLLMYVCLAASGRVSTESCMILREGHELYSIISVLVRTGSRMDASSVWRLLDVLVPDRVLCFYVDASSVWRLLDA